MGLGRIVAGIVFLGSALLYTEGCNLPLRALGEDESIHVSEGYHYFIDSITAEEFERRLFKANLQGMQKEELFVYSEKLQRVIEFGEDSTKAEDAKVNGGLKAITDLDCLESLLPFPEGDVLTMYHNHHKFTKELVDMNCKGYLRLNKDSTYSIEELRSKLTEFEIFPSEGDIRLFTMYELSIRHFSPFGKNVTMRYVVISPYGRTEFRFKDSDAFPLNPPEEMKEMFADPSETRSMFWEQQKNTFACIWGVERMAIINYALENSISLSESLAVRPGPIGSIKKPLYEVEFTPIGH